MQQMTKFEQDKIGRKEIVDRICLVVDNLQKDQHFCLALDGDWGSGKSFVLEMVEECLKQNREYVIIKYDAWANSFYSDPLIAILSCLIDGVQDKLKEIKGYKKAIKEIAKVKGVNLLEELSQKTGKLGTVASIIKSIIAIIPKFQNAHSFEENNNIADFKSYQQLLKEIKENLNTLTSYQEYRGKQTKLIILVDEIDRCLPDEQLKILERLHHLFDVKNCAMVCAVNKKSIIQNFKTTYGGNGEEYLRKFFDYNIILEMKAGEYLEELLVVELQKQIDKIFPRDVPDKNISARAFYYLNDAISGNALVLNNRSVNRYYKNLISIIDLFGWEKLNAHYLFFLIIGLFIKQFVMTNFLSKIQSQQGTFNYVRKALRIEPENSSEPGMSKVYHYKDYYLNFFNTISNHLAKNGRWNLQSADAKIITDKNSGLLKELIITYGGQNETNER